MTDVPERYWNRTGTVLEPYWHVKNRTLSDFSANLLVFDVPEPYQNGTGTVLERQRALGPLRRPKTRRAYRRCIYGLSLGDFFVILNICIETPPVFLELNELRRRHKSHGRPHLLEREKGPRRVEGFGHICVVYVS